MMKIKLLLAFVLLAITADAQVNWTNISTAMQQRVVAGATQVRWLKAPPYGGYYNLTDTLNAIIAAAGVPLSRTLTINGTTFNLSANRTWTIVSNLALGTITTTTIPVTNSNGTGFTIPAATTSLAGALGSSDKSKLDALSTSSISSPTKADWNTIPASGFRSLVYSGSTPNAPTSGSGVGFETIRTGATTNGYMAFANVNGGSDIYFRTGAGSTSFNAWQRILSQEAAATIYAPLVSPVFTVSAVLPSATSIGSISSTELGYLDNVTSSIQTQLTGKEILANKQNTLTADGTGVKFPTVDAINGANFALKSEFGSQVNPSIGLTNTNNITSSSSNKVHITNIKNEVSLTGSITLTNTSAGLVVIHLTPPPGIPSNFAVASDCAGVCTADIALTIQPKIEADPANDLIKVSYTATGSGILTVINYTCTYTIIP